MSHLPLDPRLHAYLDDELGDEARTVFEEDLQKNPDLAAALADLERQRRELRQQVAVSPEFEAALRERLERHGKRFRSRGFWIAGTAAAALLVFVVLLQTQPDPISIPAPGSHLEHAPLTESVVDPQLEAERGLDAVEPTPAEDREQSKKEKSDALYSPAETRADKSQTRQVAALAEENLRIREEQDSDSSLSAVPLLDWIPGKEPLSAPALFPLFENRMAKDVTSANETSHSGWVLYDPLQAIDCSSLRLVHADDQSFELRWNPLPERTPHACRLILSGDALPERLVRIEADDTND